MKSLSLLALLLCIVLPLSACGNEDPLPTDPIPDPEPTILDIQQVEFTLTQTVFSEAPHSTFGAFGLNKQMDTAQRGNVTFAFDPSIANEDRALCIQETQRILARIPLSHSLKICIFSGSTYPDTFIKDGTVYTNPQDWTDPEYIGALLQGLCGEFCNYGAIQGYAHYLAKEIYGQEPALWESGYPGDPDALDLNYLCFHDGFYASKDIKTHRKIANSFVFDYIESHSEAEFLSILIKSGIPEEAGLFADALGSFYQSRSIDYAPSRILYAPGGKTYDYIVRNSYATMYIEADWVDQYTDINPYAHRGFLRKNYPTAKEFYTVSTEQMGQYMALLGPNPDADNLDVCFTNVKNRVTRYVLSQDIAYLQESHHLILVYNFFLADGKCLPEGWAIGGLNSVLNYRYNLYGSATQNARYAALEDPYVTLLREELGREIDFRQDIHYLVHAYAAYHGYTHPNDDSGSSGASFIAYLMDRLGEERVLEILLETHDFGAYDFDELVADWQAYLEENFSRYMP